MSSKEWDTYEKTWAARFRENLLNAIGQTGLSDLSRRTGISQSTLSSYISGRRLPSAWNCIRIARGLGVPITDIVDYFY